MAIGVKDMQKAKHLFIDILGGEILRGGGTNPREGFQTMTFKLGGKKLELVTPLKEGEGGVGRFIEKHGEGFHHMSLSAHNLEEAKEYFEKKGIRTLTAGPEGAPLRRVFYLHPKDTFGAMIQVFREHHPEHKPGE